MKHYSSHNSGRIVKEMGYMIIAQNVIEIKVSHVDW